MSEDQVWTALALAHSDAEPERAEGIAWLLAHPDLAEPVLAAQVHAGTETNPELALRLLATIGRPESVPAIAAALHRGQGGEAFWAAEALASYPAPEAAATLRAALDHPSAEVRGAAAAALGRSP